MWKISGDVREEASCQACRRKQKGREKREEVKKE
jgi:hypothetical protein